MTDVEKPSFPVLLNDNTIRAARGLKPDRIPIWIMRQAGRYLPEFQELRKKHGFFEIVNSPELSCQVTLMPIERYDLDAAIIFSDILVIPQAIGMKVTMEPGVGPVIHKPLTTPEDVAQLNFAVDVTQAMKGTLEAITLTRHQLKGKVPLFGFTGAPWTLMSYMIEGGGSRTNTKSKGWLYKYPLESEQLLHKIGNVVIEYLVEQVASGAQLLQVFESHAEILSPDLFNKFCLPVLDRIQKEVTRICVERKLPQVPMVVFAKGGHYAIHELSKLNYEIIGIDWTIDPKCARERAGNQVTLQGNLDPCALFAPENSLKVLVKKMIDRFGPDKYICNLGHGIYPEAPMESVKIFIEAVHSYPIDEVSNN